MHSNNQGGDSGYKIVSFRLPSTPDQRDLTEQERTRFRITTSDGEIVGMALTEEDAQRQIERLKNKTSN